MYPVVGLDDDPGPLSPELPPHRSKCVKVELRVELVVSELPGVLAVRQERGVVAPADQVDEYVETLDGEVRSIRCAVVLSEGRASVALRSEIRRAGGEEGAALSEDEDDDDSPAELESMVVEEESRLLRLGKPGRIVLVAATTILSGPLLLDA